MCVCVCVCERERDIDRESFQKNREEKGKSSFENVYMRVEKKIKTPTLEFQRGNHYHGRLFRFICKMETSGLWLQVVLCSDVACLGTTFLLSSDIAVLSHSSELLLKLVSLLLPTLRYSNPFTGIGRCTCFLCFFVCFFVVSDVFTG